MFTKASGNPVFACKKVGWNFHDNGRVVCRSLELTTALGRVENTTGFVHPLDLEVARFPQKRSW
jgi:hypothetical protein